ncbi:MAG: RDD family protein [Candidatus Eremiobacteraeota bacterium]|nr:RDD family protein [Candidatus Eremiobacteraeota bacterium]
MHYLFDGPSSLRDPQERLAFWLTVPLAFPAALAIAAVLHESIGPAQVALFVVGAMLYVTLARGRLIGSSVMIHERQYPRVFSIVKRACATLEIPMPLIFAREDNYVPVAALGFGEPYALVVSSHWIEEFEDDELAFMIGRELGHIAAGHTRYLSLLSVNGRENPLVAILFGAWLRRCTLTCDKVGLLVCGSFDAALRAIAVAEFHEFGRKIDTAAFAEQAREIAGDSVLKWGTWLGSEPYATARIASLQRFVTSHTYTVAEEWFLRESPPEEPPALPTPGTAKVNVKDCSGWWRRLAAYGVDAVVVAAIMASFGLNVFEFPKNTIHFGSSETAAARSERAQVAAALADAGVSIPIARTKIDVPLAKAKVAPRGASSVGRKATGVDGRAKATATPTATPEPMQTMAPSEYQQSVDTLQAFTKRVLDFGFYLWFPVYLAVLVAFTGQTFGMMIAGLRVVTTDFRKVGPWRAIWRAFLVGVLWWLIMLLSIIWRRILLHDRMSGTRVVKAERVLARIASN